MQKIHVFDQFHETFERWKTEIVDYNIDQIDDLSFDQIHSISFEIFEEFSQCFNEIKLWNVLIVVIIKNEYLIF